MSSLVAPPRNAVDVFPQYVSIPTLDSPPAGRPRKGTHDRSSSTSMPATPSTTMKSRPKLKESCDHCAKAKVKCNKDQPTCSRCRDRHLHCGYSYSRRAGRRPGRSDSITQPTSPESCSLASPTATSSSTPNWSSNGMPSSSSMAEIISTAAGSVDSYPASLASPYMSPYMMPTVPTDQFGGYLDGYSVSSSPVNSTFGFGSLSVDHSPTMTASYSSSAGAQNPTLHGVNAFHVAGASGSAFDSSRTDIPGHPMTFTNTAMPVIPPTTNSALLPEAWLRDGQPAAATTLECRFAQTGETCVARLTKALSTQATSSTEPSTVADLMAANRSILHIAVMILSCSCASRNPQLLNLLVYAARIIITRYEIGASSGIASGNLLGDIPYLERFLSILAETLTRSGDAWAAASLDFGNGPQHHRRSLSSFSTIPAPLVEVCTRTLALKALLRQNLVAATV